MAHGDPKGYKRLYFTKRWRVLRKEVFKRDGYMCQICHKLCTGKRPHPLAPVCDHIVRHKGDEALFYNRDNLQTLHASCHDGAKRRSETSKRMQRVDGW